MLQVGQDQMSRFDATLRDRFQRRLLAQLTATHGAPMDATDAARRLHLVDTGIAKAKAYDLRDEHSAALLVNLMFIYGADLDERAAWPWVRVILGRTDVAGPVRMAQLSLTLQHQITRAAMDPVGVKSI